MDDCQQHRTGRAAALESVTSLSHGLPVVNDPAQLGGEVADSALLTARHTRMRPQTKLFREDKVSTAPAPLDGKCQLRKPHMSFL